MKTTARMVMLGAVLLAAPRVTSLDPAVGALLAVAVGAALAVVLLGAPSPLAIALGALGALAHTALTFLWPPLAGAVLLLFAFGPRALRAPTLFGSGFVACTALLCGLLATWVAASYVGAAFGVQAAAIVVATLIAAVPLVLAVDDEVAYALRGLAARSTGALRGRLLRGVVIRRRSREISRAVSRKTRKRMNRAWRSLVNAAESRVDSPGPARPTLDRRVRAYLSALERAMRAARRADLLSKDLDDAILSELELEGEDLEAQADALAEAAQIIN